MIRRPPRSTPLSLHDALPISWASANKPLPMIRDPRMVFDMLFGHGATEAERAARSEEHTSELQSRQYLVCRLLLEKKKIAGIRPENQTFHLAAELDSRYHPST